MKKTNQSAAKNDSVDAKEDVIAYRKSCDAEGTGLSHYILMDRKPADEKSE